VKFLEKGAGPAKDISIMATLYRNWISGTTTVNENTYSLSKGIFSIREIENEHQYTLRIIHKEGLVVANAISNDGT
jgi:hypothetical protein